MSVNKSHLAALLTMAALLMTSSYRATADDGCESRTGIRCSSDKMCMTLCVQKNCGFFGGYCSRLRCICTRDRAVVWGDANDDGEGEEALAMAAAGGGMLNSD